MIDGLIDLRITQLEYAVFEIGGLLDGFSRRRSPPFLSSFCSASAETMGFFVLSLSIDLQYF